MLILADLKCSTASTKKVLYEEMLKNIFQEVGAIGDGHELKVHAHIVASTELREHRVKVLRSPRSSNGIEVKLKPNGNDSTRKVILSIPAELDVLEIINMLAEAGEQIEKNWGAKKKLGTEIHRELLGQEAALEHILDGTFASQLRVIHDLLDNDAKITYEDLSHILDGNVDEFLKQIIGAYDICVRDGVEIGVKFNLSLLQSRFEGL